MARSAAEVEVFMNATPPRPWVDVALIEAEQSSEMSDDDTPQFIAKMRVSAAAMGCDGLILGGPTSRETESWADVTHDVVDTLSKKPLEKPADYGQPVTLRGMVATCIVYRDPDVAVAQEAPVAPPAEAPKSQQTTTPDPGKAPALAVYQACRQQRIDIMKRAALIRDLSARGRMFRSMPSCGEPPTS